MSIITKEIHYVEHKIKIDEIKNIFFALIKTELNEIYSLALNHYLYDRFIKVQKITGIKNKTVEFITMLLNNEISYSAYIERSLVKELSIEIDKAIISNLIKLGNEKNI